jgi:P-type conjugative transfer ATPase TrbB
VVDELHERRLEGIRHAMGEVMLAAMADPEVVEVFLNPDGTLWAEKFGEMDVIGEMSPDDSIVFLRQVASSLGVNLSKDNAIIEGELPTDGSRFEGVAPPIVDLPAFNIRKKASKVFPLSDYVAKGILPFKIAELLRAAIADHNNILVVGGTGSGKTTFCNALLHTLSEVDAASRVLIMEDTREMQCVMKNKVFLRSNEHASMQQLLRAIMRMRPDRICVGEVRGGEALALLKAWNTGHPGGLCTVHANSAYKGLTRLDQLICEVSATPQRELIGEAVQMAVFLARTPKGRRIKEVIRVHGYDPLGQKFNYEPLYQFD